ncbi:MAG: glycoside hydrolase family 43 protein [Eubacteriales bacterium]|nr:glycoside hydrolase family 43 protein [Eubacteriales bacterium]
MLRREEIPIRDPFVLRAEGRFYLYGTTGVQRRAGRPAGFLCYASENLKNFEELGHSFEAPPDFWADRDYWAPEVHALGGRYYMFASFFADNARRGSHVLAADRPEGPFVPMKERLTPPGWDCLDATLFVEEGVPYTVFCHEWLQIGDGSMCLQRLAGDLSAPQGEPRVLFHASEAPWCRAYRPGCYITDGPWLVRLTSGKLLMIWSSMSEGGYAIGMAVADSGSIVGPWRHLSEPLVMGGGHGMVFEKDAKQYLTWHTPNEPSGSERAVFRRVEQGEDRLILTEDILS